MVPNIKRGNLKEASRRQVATRVDNPNRQPGSAGKADTLPAPRTIVCKDQLLSYVVDAPLSRFAELIRSIKVAVDLEKRSKSSKVIAITSTVPNEGKSTIALSLARLMSHAGGRIVLLDFDLRNPSLSRSLAPSAKLGVLEVMVGKASLDQVAWLDPLTKLTFLPAILKPQFSHTDEICVASGEKLD